MEEEKETKYGSKTVQYFITCNICWQDTGWMNENIKTRQSLQLMCERFADLIFNHLLFLFRFFFWKPKVQKGCNHRPLLQKGE